MGRPHRNRTIARTGTIPHRDRIRRLKKGASRARPACPHGFSRPRQGTHGPARPLAWPPGSRETLGRGWGGVQPPGTWISWGVLRPCTRRPTGMRAHHGSMGGGRVRRLPSRSTRRADPQIPSLQRPWGSREDKRNAPLSSLREAAAGFGSETESRRSFGEIQTSSSIFDCEALYWFWINYGIP